ncbi:uncharacterized protein LOC123379087 [Felis catus]|uniref:uncharacterized protein LOC123379087 n=1 Tax=Felis catus TaxID=9685 RepID=UPI0003F1C4C1|nr:uncharacterized protein LOC123379087 [Felis catus]
MSWDRRPAPTRNKLNPSSSQTDTCLSVLPSLLFIYFAGWLFLTKQRLGSSLACPSAPRSTSERGRRLVPLLRGQLGPRAWVTCSKNVSAPARAAGGCPEILPKAAGTRGLSQARPGPVLRSPSPRVAPPRLGSGRGRVRRPGPLQRAVSLRELPGGALRLRLQSAAPSTGGRVRKALARELQDGGDQRLDGSTGPRCSHVQGPARESNMHPQPVIQDAWLLVTCLPASPRQQPPEKAPVACEVGKLDTVVSRRSEVTEQQLSVSKATRPPNGRTGTGVWISAIP